MARLSSKPTRIYFLIALAIAGSTFAAGLGSTGTEARARAQARRTALWQALTKVLPREARTIDAYAESPALTAILFRSAGRTFRFSMGAGKVEEVLHMRPVGPINCITVEVEEGSGDASWVLWHDGKRESTIGFEGQE